MPIAPSRAESHTPPVVSLRRNFAWTFAGYVVSGVCQWGVLSLIAKLGSSQMLGEYALALAVIAPVAMLSHLNLRAVLATDVDERHGFGDYLAVRLWTTGIVLAVMAVIAYVSGYGYDVSACMLLIGASLSADIVSDIYYAALQRNERMRQIAISMMSRGILALAAFGTVLLITGKLVPAVATLALARIIVLLLYDRPEGSRGQTLARAGMKVQWEIFRTALPLGVVLMLVSFTGNVSRYAVEHYLGRPELGVFAAVAAFLTAGTLVANALGQVATPRLARHYSRKELPEFGLLSLKLAGLAVALGAFGVLCAALFGSFVLRTLYRVEYAEYGRLLTEVMAAGTCVYVAVVLGYVITSARSFLAQMPLLAVVATTAAVASWTLVPARGLSGAALAVAIAASVQIGGSLLLLRRALVRSERAT